ncbi:MAG: exodeoxyribonuclease VII small subunit [Methylacidiphilales bacterium]|nr:exodeoxyribonuclease VII small subunit [Candidatus Methylacidiphilales bacterium]
MSNKVQKNKSFNSLMQELESCVRQLEQDGLPFEEAMQTYEQGMVLSKQLTTMLEQAKLKLTHIDNATNSNKSL